MSDVLIKVDGISKKFCRSFKKSLWYGMQDLGSELLGKPHGIEGELRPDEFWAVNDVSFELKRGECLGLIGRNGAGKTTLLKMLNGLIKPDKGKIEIVGRVGALIALGAGFNPILTGRENIYVNASVLGLSKKEVDSKLEEIIDFAEIEEFIDSPVQNYSSGMQVRLGFAIASAIEPDVLLLDEVLAVGDAAFRAKCYNRIGTLQNNSAVIFVSHFMEQVAQISSRVLTLKKGRVTWLGGVRGAVDAYSSDVVDTGKKNQGLLLIEHPVQAAEVNFCPDKIEYADYLTLHYEIDLLEDMLNSSIRIPIYNADGIVVADWNSRSADLKIDLKKGRNRGEIEIGPIHLSPGTYCPSLVLNDATGVFMPFWSLKQHKLNVLGRHFCSASYFLPTVKTDFNTK